MTAFRLRTAPDQPLPDEVDTLILDWFSGAERPASTIHATTELLDGLAPTAAALDLYHLGGAVYCIDKVALRTGTADAWTRDLKLDSPVRSRRRWNEARTDLTLALSFLSGDRWRLTFRSAAGPIDGTTADRRPDAICLFSGGLDSLAGAIDLLERGLNVLLVGHFESGFVGGLQAELARRLKDVYGERVRMRQLQLTAPAPSSLQARPLPGDRETTTRARSFLFVAAGLAVASAFGDDVPLYVPENGFISINVPLVASRVGSLSTRTTHPYFLARLQEALPAIGIENQLLHPYRLKTKGEVISGCGNASLLRSLVQVSVSCAHPEQARWNKLPPSNCGYCYPCLVRRAALHSVGLDDAASYRRDALTEDRLLDEDVGADLRAVVRGLLRPTRPSDVLRNGSVPAEDAAASYSVYRRGRDELEAWFSAGSGTRLRTALGIGMVPG
jgi:7-cyano-7-deazaguanine synthase in queuosine biosynthesis